MKIKLALLLLATGILSLSLFAACGETSPSGSGETASAQEDPETTGEGPLPIVEPAVFPREVPEPGFESKSSTVASPDDAIAV